MNTAAAAAMLLNRFWVCRRAREPVGAAGRVFERGARWHVQLKDCAPARPLPARRRPGSAPLMPLSYSSGHAAWMFSISYLAAHMPASWKEDVQQTNYLLTRLHSGKRTGNKQITL